MNKIHRVHGITFTDLTLVLIVDGKRFEIDLAKHSPVLLNATPDQKNNFELSPSGYGIHWPDLDEDLSIDSLIGVKHMCPFRHDPATTIQEL